MLPEYNEEIIVAQLQDPRRCREAFALVVRHYSQSLYWQIRKMVVSHDDADDLLQNTFLKAWSSISYFRAEARLSTWLYRIAINETLTFLAKQRQQNNIPIDGEDSFLAERLESDEWNTAIVAGGHIALAREATAHLQYALFRRNEVRRYFPCSRNFGGGIESLLSSCRQENRRIFNIGRLNLTETKQSKYRKIIQRQIVWEQRKKFGRESTAGPDLPSRPAITSSNLPPV